MKKIILCFCLFFASILFLSACEKKQQESFPLRQPFADFLLEEGYGALATTGKGENQEEYVQLELPSGFLCRYYLVYKEPNGNKARIYCKALSTDWDFREYDAMKQDLQYFKTIVDVFAVENGWEEDYELYSEMGTYMGVTEEDRLGYGMYYTYNHQNNDLYVSANHEKYIKLCRMFNATSLKEIAAHEEGRQLLLENGFGEMVDGEYEEDDFLLHSSYIDRDSKDGSIQFNDYLFDFLGKKILVIK